jgi:hypothetical protein
VQEPFCKLAMSNNIEEMIWEAIDANQVTWMLLKVNVSPILILKAK